MEAIKTNIKSAIGTMLRVNFALILRETKTRYGRLQIGYIWAFLEPILIVAVLSFVFTYIRMKNIPGLPLVQFLMTGYISFMLFRDIVIQTMMGVRRNLQLLYFPQVQVIDIFTARTLLEFSTTLIVFPILIFLVSFTGIEEVTVKDPLGILVGFSLISIYSFGIGAGLGALIPLFPSLQILVTTVFMRPMFFLSGVFFTIEMLPESVKPYAALNPMLQFIEIIRSSYFINYESNWVDIPYLFTVITLTLLIGLLLQKALRRHAFKL